jgi:hypothetical protein
MPVVKVLNPMLTSLAGYIKERGLRFIDMIYDADLASEILREFKWFSLGDFREGFIHRFVRIHDVVNLLTALRRICEVHGSLRSFVEELYVKHSYDHEPMEGVIKDLQEALLKYGGKPPLVPRARVPA